MNALEQLMKLAGNLPLDKLAQFLPLDKLPLDKLAGNALGKIDAYKNRDRMSSVDTAWLRMDTPTNLMMIVGVMMFDGAPDPARIKRTLEARLSRYNRFRQRVVQDPSGAYWVEDEHFDIGNHLHTVNLATGKNGEAASKLALEEYVAALTTQSLDFNKPLWHMTVVERYEGDGVAGHALIIRIHHCIADGIALIGVMYSLFDEDATAAEAGVEPEGLRRAREKREAKQAAAGERDFMESLFAPVSGTAAKALSVSGNVASRYMDMMSNPEKFAGYAKIAAAVTAEIAELAMMPNDSQTRLKGKPSAVKRVAWSAPLPLTEIKAVCKVLGVSVNDILLASVAGALRGYLAEPGRHLRSFIPKQGESLRRIADFRFVCLQRTSLIRAIGHGKHDPVAIGIDIDAAHDLAVKFVQHNLGLWIDHLDAFLWFLAPIAKLLWNHFIQRERRDIRDPGARTQDHRADTGGAHQGGDNKSDSIRAHDYGLSGNHLNRLRILTARARWHKLARFLWARIPETLYEGSSQHVSIACRDIQALQRFDTVAPRACICFVKKKHAIKRSIFLRTKPDPS